MPDIGEDPVRALARLPGVASQDFSSRVSPAGRHARGDSVPIRRPAPLQPLPPEGFLRRLQQHRSRRSSATSGSTPAGFPVAFGDRSSGVVDIAPRLAGAGIPGRGGRVDDHHRRRRSTAASRMAPTTGPSLHDAATWTCSSTSSTRRSVSRSTTTTTPTWVIGSTTGLRSPPMRSRSTTRSWPSTATRKKKATAEYRDHYYWLRVDLGAADGLRRARARRRRPAGKRALRHRRPAGRRQRHAARTSRHFTINSIQADGWWRIGARSLLQGGRRVARAAGSLRLRRTRPSSTSCS